MGVTATVDAQARFEHGREAVTFLREEIGVGAEESYEEFFDRLLPRAIAVGRRIGGTLEDGEDAAVEGLARAHLHWQELQGAAHRDAWALRVTANAAYDQLRRRVRSERRGAEATRGQDATELVDLRQSLAPLLRRLSRRQREVVVLSFMVGLSHEEIASLLGCSVGSVKVHARRGLVRLRSSRSSLEDPSKKDDA